MRTRTRCGSGLRLVLLGLVAFVPLVASACNKRSGVGNALPDAGAAGPLVVSVEECRELYDRAQVEAGEAWDRAQKNCTTDRDCVLATRRACLPDCGGISIASSSFGEWKKAYDRLEATMCKRYRDNCLAKVPVAIPTCPAFRPVCEGGRCIAK